jgi:hypothetical protein
MHAIAMPAMQGMSASHTFSLQVPARNTPTHEASPRNSSRRLLCLLPTRAHSEYHGELYSTVNTNVGLNIEYHGELY